MVVRFPNHLTLFPKSPFLMRDSQIGPFSHTHHTYLEECILDIPNIIGITYWAKLCSSQLSASAAFISPWDTKLATSDWHVEIMSYLYDLKYLLVPSQANLPAVPHPLHTWAASSSSVAQVNYFALSLWRINHLKHNLNFRRGRASSKWQISFMD